MRLCRLIEMRIEESKKKVAAKYARREIALKKKPIINGKLSEKLLFSEKSREMTTTMAF